MLRDPAIRLELRRLIALSWPVVAAQVGSMTLGLVDIAMVGRLGASTMAAASLGDVAVHMTLLVAMGVMLGLDPVVSQAHGGGRGAEAGLALQRGLVLSLLVSLPVMAAWWFPSPLLRATGQSEALLPGVEDYTRAQVLSVPAFLMFVALRQYLQGRGMTMGPLWVVAGANVFNFFADWGLIFGRFGLPALGLRGAGLATGLTRLFMLVALAALVFSRGWHRGAWVPWSRASFRLGGLFHILRFGIPVGIQFALEVWAFNAASLLAGRLGEVPLAAHTAVLKLASLSFMMPLGISIAAATRVGNLLGAGDRAGAQRSAYLALAMGAGVMAVAAVLFALFRRQLPHAFTDDPRVLADAAAILPIAAAFQLFDGTQVVGGGVLRGMGDARPAAVYNLVGYYLLALPLAWWLGFSRGNGLPGIWWGLCAGLLIVASLLVMRIRRRGPGRA